MLLCRRNKSASKFSALSLTSIIKQPLSLNNKTAACAKQAQATETGILFLN